MKGKKNQILSWPEATWGYALDHKWFQLRWAAVEDFQPGWKREREMANETQLDFAKWHKAINKQGI